MGWWGRHETFTAVAGFSGGAALTFAVAIVAALWPAGSAGPHGGSPPASPGHPFAPPPLLKPGSSPSPSRTPLHPVVGVPYLAAYARPLPGPTPPVKPSPTPVVPSPSTMPSPSPTALPGGAPLLQAGVRVSVAGVSASAEVRFGPQEGGARGRDPLSRFPGCLDRTFAVVAPPSLLPSELAAPGR